MRKVPVLCYIFIKQWQYLYWRTELSLENWAVNRKEKRMVKTADKKFLSYIPGYILTDHIKYTDIREQLKICNLNYKINNYKFNWPYRVLSMDNILRTKKKNYNMFPPGDKTWEEPEVDGRKTSVTKNFNWAYIEGGEVNVFGHWTKKPQRLSTSQSTFYSVVNIDRFMVSFYELFLSMNSYPMHMV